MDPYHRYKVAGDLQLEIFLSIGNAITRAECEIPVDATTVSVAPDGGWAQFKRGDGFHKWTIPPLGGTSRRVDILDFPNKKTTSQQIATIAEKAVQLVWISWSALPAVGTNLNSVAVYQLRAGGTILAPPEGVSQVIPLPSGPAYVGPLLTLEIYRKRG